VVLFVCFVIPFVILLSSRVKLKLPAMLGLCGMIVGGMWLERFVIVAVSLHRDFLPSSWAMYIPTVWDYATLLGSIGLFLTLLFLFIRFLPVISIFEMRELVVEKQEAQEEAAS